MEQVSQGLSAALTAVELSLPWSPRSFVQGLPCGSGDQTPEARRHLPTGEAHRSKRRVAYGVKLPFAAAWAQRTMQTAYREPWFVPCPSQSSAPRREAPRSDHRENLGRGPEREQESVAFICSFYLLCFVF